MHCFSPSELVKGCYLSLCLLKRLNQDNKDGVWDFKLHRLARLRGFSCHPVGSSTTSFFSWPIIKVEATTNPVSDACVACPFTRTLATKTSHSSGCYAHGNLILCLLLLEASYPRLLYRFRGQIQVISQTRFKRGWPFVKLQGSAKPN